MFFVVVINWFHSKIIFYILYSGPLKPGEGEGELGGLGGCSPPQIFAKFDLLPIDNYSEKKKVAKNI